MSWPAPGCSCLASLKEEWQEWQLNYSIFFFFFFLSILCAISQSLSIPLVASRHELQGLFPFMAKIDAEQRARKDKLILPRRKGMFAQKSPASVVAEHEPGWAWNMKRETHAHAHTPAPHRVAGFALSHPVHSHSSAVWVLPSAGAKGLEPTVLKDRETRGPVFSSPCLPIYDRACVPSDRAR